MASRFGRPFREVIFEAAVDLAVLLALAHPDSPVNKFEAADVFVRRQGLSRPNPAAQRMLKLLLSLEGCGRDDQRQRWEYHAEWSPAVGTVLATDRIFEQPQPIRLGRSWVSGEDGKPVRLRPADLDPRSLERWLRQQVQKYLADIFRDERSVAVEAAPALAAGDPGDKEDRSDRIARKPRIHRELSSVVRPPTPLEALMATEAARETDELLEALGPQISPRERELLELLAEDPDRKDLPTLLGVQDATVRVMRHHLRRKALREKREQA